MATHDAGVPLPARTPGSWPPGPPARSQTPGSCPAAPGPTPLAADIALLREGGYLKLAVPVRLGGAGRNLRQVACAQRRLAARAPAAAFAVNAHHAWIGAAADTLASGGPADPVAGWLLREAAQGAFIAAGLGRPREPRATSASSKPWRAIRRAGTGPVRRSPTTAGPGGPPGDTPSPAARAAPGLCPPCRLGRRGTR